MIDLPSGVSSNILAANATLAISVIECPQIGKKDSARRFPKVIVPVLSKINVLISPQASTACPEVAIILNWATLSIPAMPMALSKLPIVVGMSATNRETSMVILTGDLT